MAMDARKQRILEAIVALYANDGEPVGSGLLANYFDMALSSATLRNEMAALTKLGLLEQPHTSAGRVPSAQAAITTGASRSPAASTMLAVSTGFKSCGATKVSPRLSSCARLAASSRVRPVSTRATRVRTPPALVTTSTAAE